MNIKTKKIIFITLGILGFLCAFLSLYCKAQIPEIDVPTVSEVITDYLLGSKGFADIINNEAAISIKLYIITMIICLISTISSSILGLRLKKYGEVELTFVVVSVIITILSVTMIVKPELIISYLT